MGQKTGRERQLIEVRKDGDGAQPQRLRCGERRAPVHLGAALAGDEGLDDAVFERMERHHDQPAAGKLRPDDVIVAVDGVAIVTGWALSGGSILFDVPPAEGARVTAGFRFDVPVRFESDRLDISGHRPDAGDIAHVPLIEVREA